MCKDCYSIWRTDHYKKYKDTYDKQREKRRGTISFRYSQLKSKSKKRELLFDLTVEEFETLVSKPCFYCENKLSIKVTSGCGLDRLDSKLGYVADNCVSCCAFCNCVKNDLLTPEEMKKVAALLIAEREGGTPINVHASRKRHL